MTQDRPMIGISLMFLFCVFAPLGDAVAKMLGGVYALGFLVLVRFVTQTLVLGPITIWRGQLSTALLRRIWRQILLRAALHILGIFAMFAALQFLPLAEAVAIAFVMPFIMLLLGWAVLNEPVGPRRIAACAVGFVGTLMVVQPSFAAVGWPALLPLAVAVIFALFMLITRQIARDIDPIDLQTATGTVAISILLPVLWAGHSMEIASISFDWVRVGDWNLILALGLLGTLGHLAMTWALRFAPSTVLAPMQYLEIPIATLIGWAIFGDLPNGLAAAGIAVTIAAGLFVIWMEQRHARHA